MAYGDRTGAKPITIDGVTFHCYHTGILRYEWRSEDSRLRVQRNYNSDTHCASVDGTSIEGANPLRARRFRTFKGAMAAAVLRLRLTENGSK